MISWLSERGESARPRALLLVSGGLDLRPEAYYRAYLDAGSADGEARVRDDHAALTRAVAAYGWLTIVIQRPEPDPLPRRWG